MELPWILGMLLGVVGAVFLAFEIGKAFGAERAKSWGRTADEMVDVLRREEGEHVAQRRKLQEIIDRFQADREKILGASWTLRDLLSNHDVELAADTCEPLIGAACNLIEIALIDREFEDEDLAGTRHAQNESESFRSDQVYRQAERRDRDIEREARAARAAKAATDALNGSSLESAAPQTDRSAKALEAELAEVRREYEALEESFVRHRKAADDVAISMVRRAEEERKAAIEQVKGLRKQLKSSYDALGLLQMASVLVKEPGRSYADGKVEYLWFGTSIDGATNAHVILDASKNGNRAMQMPDAWKKQIAKEWGVLKS